MSNTITGRIAVLKPTQVVSDKFSKREFVIETTEQYPQLIPMEFQMDKCSLLDNFKLGQEVSVSVNLRGRKWTSPQGEDKYFATIQAWRIEPLTVTKAEPQAQGTIDDFPHF
jgi:hypothetical protein